MNNSKRMERNKQRKEVNQTQIKEQEIKVTKVKLSLYRAVETHRVVRR
jgi:hypothetical protein